MYDYSNYSVENPINRYSLASDNPLIKNQDETVMFYILSTSPGKDKEANWLPSPSSDRWYIMLRAYSPEQLTIESAYNTDIYPSPAVKMKCDQLWTLNFSKKTADEIKVWLLEIINEMWSLPGSQIYNANKKSKSNLD